MRRDGQRRGRLRDLKDASPVRFRRVLVREVNWLGDLVMSVPALRALRGAQPGAHLTVLVRDDLASFFDGVDWLDAVVQFRVRPGLAGVGDRLRVVREIRSRRFDLAVVLPRSFESALWTAVAGVPERVGFVDDARRLLLTKTTARTPDLLARHQVHDHLFLLRETLQIEGNSQNFSLDVHEPHRLRMRSWLAAHRRRSGRVIAMAVAAAFGPAKEWPAERYAALVDLLAERYDAECVLLGAPSERRRCAEVATSSRHGALVAAGETSVGELLALLSLCDGFAGNDSGAMHVAGALGLPTVGIFGSTRPERTAPLGARTRTLYQPIECSPCMARTCRYGHYDCLKRIEVDEVAGALRDLGAFG